MQLLILAPEGVISSFQARVIDEPMGVVGGELQVTDLYLSRYQGLFRKHLLEPNWSQIEVVSLKAITETGYELNPQGGIAITDLKEFPNEIFIEVCGLSLEDIALTRG